MRIYVHKHHFMGTFDDLIRSNFTFLPSGILCAGIWDLGVGGNTNFPEVLLKAVQDPFDSRIQSVVTFPRMRTFCMSLLLFLPLLPRDIVSSSLRELWASISLGVFLLPVVPSLINAMYRFFCCPWSWFSLEQEYLLTSSPRDVGSPNSNEDTLHFTVSFMLLDCGHRVISL